MDAVSSPDEGSEDRPQTADLLSAYAPEPNAMERKALSFLEGELPEGSVPIDAQQRARLRTLQRRTVWIGVASGTMSGLLLGGLEIWLSLGLIGDEDRGLLDDPVPWSLFYGVVGIVTLVEILFLYWITLRAVAQLKRTIGVPGGHNGMADLVRAALARAALESPNPSGAILGVDPHAFKPRWLLFARNLVYKAKVGVTSFVLRIALRRLFVRAVLRSYVPLLAAPLYAAWNAWILHRIMEEARVRSFGPFAVREILDLAEAAGGEPRTRTAILAGVVELVRRSGDGHPNYVLLLHGLKAALDVSKDQLSSSDDHGRAALEAVPGDGQETVCDILLLACVLSGRTTRRQTAYLLEAHGWLGRAFDPACVGQLRRRLRDGERLTAPNRTSEHPGAMQLETATRLPTP